MPHLDAAFNYARWLTRSDVDAEDLVQEACVRAMRFLSSLRDGRRRASPERNSMEVSQSTAPPPQGDVAAPAPEPRQLAAGDGIGWWGESWRIFCAAPTTWLGILVLFVVLSIALVLVPIVGSLIHTVLTPVFAGGVMLGCHALARGEPLRVGHLFEGFQGSRFASSGLR